MAEGCATIARSANRSLARSNDDETKNIIVLSNLQTATTGFRGTRICVAEPPGDEGRLAIVAISCRKPHTSFLEDVLTGLSR